MINLDGVHACDGSSNNSLVITCYVHRRKLIKLFPSMILPLCWLACSHVLDFLLPRITGSVKLRIRSSRIGDSHTTWLLMKSRNGCCSCSSGSVLLLGPWKSRLSKQIQSAWTHVLKQATLPHLDGKDMVWCQSNRICILLYYMPVYMCNDSEIMVITVYTKVILVDRNGEISSTRPQGKWCCPVLPRCLSQTGT